MKRKKAMAFNAPGGTREYIGATAQNLINNRMFPEPVSCNCGVDVYGGTDYSYSVSGIPSGAYRKTFDPLDWEFIRDNDLLNDVFKIGKFFVDGCTKRIALFFFGWRIVIEYFDVNAVVDFTNEIEPGMPLNTAVEKFCKIYSRKYECRILNEHLVNIKSL